MLFKLSFLAACLLAITSASPLIESRQEVNNAPDKVSAVEPKFAFEGPQEKVQKAVAINVVMAPAFLGTSKQAYVNVHLNQLTMCTDKEGHTCLATKINHATASISDAGGFDSAGLACQAYRDSYGLVPIGQPFAEDITVEVGGPEGTYVASFMCTLLGTPLQQPS